MKTQECRKQMGSLKKQVYIYIYIYGLSRQSQVMITPEA